MRRARAGWGLWLALGLAPGAWAQALPSLADALEAAWQRAAVSAEAAGQLRRAQAEGAAASALWAAPPALELGSQQDRQAANSIRREHEIGLNLPLWLPGQRTARQAQVQAELQVAAAASLAARLRLAGVLREAASALALQQAELDSAEAQLGTFEALARDVERRVAAGELARADALAAQAERLAAANTLAQTRQRLQAAELRWFALTGLKGMVAPEAAPTDAAPADSHTGEPAHPALRLAALRVQAARERVQVAEGVRREAPRLIVKASQELAAGTPHTNGVGLALRIPFATADRHAPLLAAALSELDLAQALEHEQQLQLEAERASAQLAQAAARQQLADERARAQLLRERAGLLQTAFQAGETGLPELLRALSAATQAQAAVARAQAALAQAASRLLQAQGVLP